MHEVEVLVAHTLEHQRVHGGRHRAPAHVRQDLRPKSLHRAGPLAETRGLHAVLHTGVEEHLHAHADPQHRQPTREPSPDEVGCFDGGQPRHAGGERTHPGDHETICRHDRVGISGDLDRRPGPLEGALRGAEIAGAVVKDDYGHQVALHA